MSEGEDRTWWRVAVGGGAGMFVAMGIGRFSYTALVPALIESGRLGELEAGLIGGFNLFGFLVGAFLSGRLARSLPARHRLTLWVWLCLLGLACSALPLGFAWLAWWRGVVGAMTALIMIGSVAVATADVPEARRAWAAGTVYAGVGFGILLSGTAVPSLVAIGIDWAWGGLAGLGLAGALIAQWGWRRARDANSGPPAPAPRLGTLGPALTGLVAAHFLFSLALVPHTLYWVDFIARELGQGLGTGGAHWAFVGVFAALGPLAAVILGGRLGNAAALLVSFVILGIGIAAPAASEAFVFLAASTVIFGAQPGLATLLSARVRDLGTADGMAGLMRVMILANAVGSGIGGLASPMILEVVGDPRPLFLFAGVAMALGAVCCMARPRGAR